MDEQNGHNGAVTNGSVSTAPLMNVFLHTDNADHQALNVAQGSTVGQIAQIKSIPNGYTATVSGRGVVQPDYVMQPNEALTFMVARKTGGKS